jgi:hypothetical protein
MRRTTRLVAFTVAIAGFAAAPAGAHERHASCMDAGQLAASLASSAHPLGQQVSVVARVGGVDEFIAGVHATVCESRP